MNNFKAVSLEGGSVDKYAHFTFYFIFTILWCLYLKCKDADRKLTQSKRILVFTIAVVLGILIEIGQGAFTDDRNADISDVIANTSGSAVAILVIWLLSKKKQIV